MRGAAAGDRASGAVGTCQHRSRFSRCGCWGGAYCTALVLCAAYLSLSSCRHVLCESVAGRGGAASCASHSQARARAVTAGGRRAGGRVGGRVDWLRRARGVRLAARGLRLAARGSRLAARGSPHTKADEETGNAMFREGRRRWRCGGWTAGRRWGGSSGGLWLASERRSLLFCLSQKRAARAARRAKVDNKIRIVFITCVLMI